MHNNFKNNRFKKTIVKTAKRRKNASTLWLKRQLNDPYVNETKKLNYRSRAAFKIIDINNKYSLFKEGMNIVDLGCAPGGWLQIIKNYIGNTGNLIGIDILDVEPMDNTKIIKGDFTEEITVNKALKLTNNNKLDGVVSDMASNTTGHKKTDHIRIMELVEHAAYFSLENLNNGGFFVAKVFAGGTESELLMLLKKHFTKTFHYKPPSSRKESAEIYLVAIGFKNNYN